MSENPVTPREQALARIEEAQKGLDEWNDDNGFEREINPYLATLKAVLELPEREPCPIEGCENKYEAGEVAGYNQAISDFHALIIKGVL